MSKELTYLHFVQMVMAVNSLILIFGIQQARKGDIALHKKINGMVGGELFLVGNINQRNDVI